MTYSLGVAMIARNEERCLARALASLAPYRIAGLIDDLVVLDTGSTDSTIMIALAHGATVVEMAWADDFAHARNAALEEINTDWVLMLDADEWLDNDATAALIELRASPPTFVGEIDVVSQIATRTQQSESMTTTHGWIPRVLPAGVRWVGRIHEQPHWGGAFVHTAITAHHDGYSPPVLATKRGRNVALLRTEITARPHDPMTLLQLGRALEAEGEHGEAAERYLNALALMPPALPERHDLVVRLLFTLGQAGRTEEALELAERELARWNDSPDFHFCLGDLLLHHGLSNPGASADVLTVIEQSWLRCLELGEHPELVGAVAGRGSDLAAYNLAVLYEALGHDQKAEQFRQRYCDLRALRSS